MSDAAAPDPRQRLSERFEQIAADLFALEINTVLKPNMTATPWPGVGHGLLDIASEFEAKLASIQRTLLDGGSVDPELAALEQRRAASHAVDGNFASHRRFDELRTWAKALCSALQRTLAPGDEGGEVQRAVWMISRIRDNSDQIKGVFDVLRAQLGADPPLITRANANLVRLDVREQDRGVLRKIWEIGIEEVVMQTVIHLDGDIVMRVQPEFARESGRELMRVHNETVQAAVGFWKVLVDVIGSALKWFVGK